MMRTRDVALIRKLCSLGLSPQALVQSLLPALREIVPAHSGGVFWVDGNAQMTALYAERLLEPDAMAAYYEKHYADAVKGFSTAFKRRASAEDTVSTHSFSEAEKSSDYFRETLRPLDAYHVLYAILTHRGAPYAQLSLYRGASNRAFDETDQAAIRNLLRYIAAALYDPDREQMHAGESLVVEEGLGVVKPSGEIVGGTEEWHRLIRLAALTHVTPSRASQEGPTIASFVRDLARPLAQGASSIQADAVRSTPWGRFVIKRFRLHGPSLDDQLVGLLIRREESRALSLVRGAGHSPLSPQQREVALLLAQGKTNVEIAGALGLSLNTASYHVKQVFSKLCVNERNEVKERLLALAPTTPPPVTTRRVSVE